MKVFQAEIAAAFICVVCPVLGKSGQSKIKDDPAPLQSAGSSNSKSAVEASPARVSARIIIPETQTASAIAAVESSPDARFLLTQQSGRVSIWDLTGNQPKVFDGIDINRVAFGPDNKHVLVGRGCDAELWDLDIPKKLQTLSGTKIGLGDLLNGVNALDFSPDGRFAVTGNDSTIALWNLSTGEPVRVFRQVENDITEIRLFPDGERVLVRRARGKLQIVRLTDGQIVEEFTQASGYGMSLYCQKMAVG